MSTFVNYSLQRYEDGALTIVLSPPAPIGGSTIRWVMQHRFGGLSGIATKFMASGFNGTSGITMVNSGVGIFTVSVASADTSGLDYGAYATTTEKLDIGARTTITRGYLNLLPGGLP